MQNNRFLAKSKEPTTTKYQVPKLQSQSHFKINQSFSNCVRLNEVKLVRLQNLLDLINKTNKNFKKLGKLNLKFENSGEHALW